MKITRRDFLKGTAGIAAATALGLPSKGRAAEMARVVLVRDRDVLGPNGEVRSQVLQSMLDEGVKRLQGRDEPLAAWQDLFKKSDVVGIKSNSWHNLPTPPEMEEAIRKRLIDTGISGENIAVADRGVLDNPLFMRSTALVNTRPVRTHHWAGVGTLLKNYIQFVPSPSEYHPNGCADLGRIWTLPHVKGKTRLNVLVALTPQFYGRGANFFDRRYVWPYGGIIVGTDPVAVDAVGAEILRLKRVAAFGEDRPLDVAPIHIAEADKKYHLGISDLSRIQIVKVGWMGEALV
ncbi:MAG: twin-arginine translocation signal domain-containing protein [Syntrophorhabdales bacterium]|jgi:hypothetical protein